MSLVQPEPSFFIPGPCGNIEAVMNEPQNVIPNNIAIICHPHPLFGGTLTNKVVTTIMRAFNDVGVPAVRFNFRGVGKSEGKFADGIGEVDDLLAVVAWVNHQYPQAKISLAGFSFGAAMSAIVASRIEVLQLVSVAPPVPRFNLLNLPPITCPWVVVQGEQDDVVEPAEVYAWVATREPRPVLIRVPEVGHFFHGKLLELREVLVYHLLTFVDQ